MEGETCGEDGACTTACQSGDKCLFACCDLVTSTCVNGFSNPNACGQGTQNCKVCGAGTPNCDAGVCVE